MASPTSHKLANNGHNEDAPQSPKRPSRWKRYINKIGLDARILVIMLKGSVAPTIAIAMYQATAISSYFRTLGYLIAIISVLCVPILPRGKFVQAFALNLFAICLGAAVSLLAIWSSIQARSNTTSPTSPAAALGPPPYNSSQSAVCGVWLFFSIWAANFLRAALPSFTLPAIIYSIFISISTTTGPTLPTTERAEAFVKQLLCAMLFGLGLATGVSLLIFPITSRMVVMAELKAIIGLVRAAGNQEKQFIEDWLVQQGAARAAHAVEHPEPIQNGVTLENKTDKNAKDGITNKLSTTAETLRKTTNAIRSLTARVPGDLVFAKREIAWGHLDAADMSETFSLISNVMIPIVAMSRILDAVNGQSHGHSQGCRDEHIDEDGGAQEKQIPRDVMKQFHEPFRFLATSIDQGLQHAGICLQILPRPKTSGTSRGQSDVDMEAHGEPTNPGDRGFGKVIDETIQRACSQNDDIVQSWTREINARGVDDATLTQSLELRAQSYFILYIEPMIRAAGEATRNLVEFADNKVEKGTMSRKRLIWGNKHLLRKWMMSIFRNRKTDAGQGPDMTELDDVYYYGGSFSPQMDPEHLPATSIWQHIGDGLRTVSAALGSRESGFGLRVACATMTVGILAFLEATQRFFLDQRLIWALITIALWMTTTSGQSVFGLFLRLGGTVLGMVSSLIIWYIVDQKTAGVIVFLWLFIFVESYFFKFPRMIPAVLITIVTQILIIGYELQVRQIGQAIATQTGQPYYPTYLLAPYRLAVVAGGSLVAFFWTIFPFPLTDRTWLRQNLATTMYVLGNYFSAAISTFESRIEETEGRSDPKTSRAFHHISSARRKTFQKVIRLVSSVESHIQWQRWEPVIGGRFPTETYREINMRSSRLMGWISLMSYALTRPRPSHKAEGKAREGLEGRNGASGEMESDPGKGQPASGLQGIQETHRAVLSVLASLSSSLLSGRRLPPLEKVSKPHGTIWRPRLLLDESVQPVGDDEGRVGAAKSMVRHRPDVELNGFFITELCIDLVCDDVDGLTRAVRRLVGEVDFSVRADNDRLGTEASDEAAGKNEAIGLRRRR